MELEKDVYRSLTSNMSDTAVDLRSEPVTTEPNRISEAESYVLELDATQVATWSPTDVANKFVEKIGCRYANEIFISNKINGKSLMLLREDHLQEMGVQAIGDRVYMIDMIRMLKKKKMEVDTSATKWSGDTPVGCTQYCFPCCFTRTYWKVTGQGVFTKTVPPCRKCFASVSTEYMDYRFFKDLELKEEYLCCCFFKRYTLEMYVRGKSDQNGGNKIEEWSTPRLLIHPEAPKVERIIRNAWNSARLVAE